MNNTGKCKLRRLRVTFLSCKCNKCYTFWVCVCNLSYPARKAHATYYIVISVLSGWTTFLYIISQAARFSEKCYWMFDFSLQLWLKYFSIYEEFSEMLSNTYIGLLHVKHPLFLLDFDGTWIFSTDFWKMLKFHTNMFSGSRVVPCGQTDRQTDRQTRHDGANSRFSQFCESA